VVVLPATKQVPQAMAQTILHRDYEVAESSTVPDF
jgi:hypothetical protein